jgi:hypothetical protein
VDIGKEEEETILVEPLIQPAQPVEQPEPERAPGHEPDREPELVPAREADLPELRGAALTRKPISFTVSKPCGESRDHSTEAGGGATPDNATPRGRTC